jgi:hypothetical protein
MTEVSVAADPKLIAAQCRSKPVVFDAIRSDLCPALASLILDRMRRDGGRRTASLNVGGWKSGEDFFTWTDSAVQELRRTIVDMIGARSPVAWAMVNRAGSHHPRHQHRVASVTGVYYVTIGDVAATTPTIFEYEDGEVAINPSPGRLALFRGETWHRVPVYSGDLPRITIAFDIRR